MRTSKISETNAPENKESKRDKFVRVVESLTNKIVHMIKLLKNCSNKNTYEYTDADIDKIFTALEQELKETKKAFQTVNVKASGMFTLE